MSPLLVFFLVLVAFGCAFFLSERVANRWTISRRQRREQAGNYFEEEPRGRQPEERRDEP
jgi:hypothetical protein